MLPTRVRKQAEVFVFGEKDTRLEGGTGENDLILGAWTAVDNCSDIMACGTKRGDHREVTAFVGQETQQLDLIAGGILADEYNLFVGERVRGIPHRRVKIGSR